MEGTAGPGSRGGDGHTADRQGGEPTSWSRGRGTSWLQNSVLINPFVQHVLKSSGFQGPSGHPDS